MKPHSKITILFFFLFIGVTSPINSYPSDAAKTPTNKTFKLEINNIFLILSKWNSKLNERETLQVKVKLLWNICNPDVFIQKNIIFHKEHTKDRIKFEIIDTLRTYAGKNEGITNTKSINKALVKTLGAIGICTKNIEIKRITRHSS